MKERNYSRKIAFTASQYRKERDYWLNRLSGDWIKTGFPRDTLRAGVEGQPFPERAEFRFRWQGSLFSRLVHVSKDSDLRLHIILVTALTALLHRYTGAEDLPVGIPTYKQEAAGERVNTVLVLRNRVTPGLTFRELLMQVGQTVWEANEHQNYPVEALLQKLGFPLSGEDFPLFDLAVLLENIHDKGDVRHVNPNMIFAFSREKEWLEGVVDYRPQLFTEVTLEVVTVHLRELLERALADSNCPVERLPFLGDREKRQLLVDFNDNRADFSRERTICHFLEHHAGEVPDRIAMMGPGVRVSAGSRGGERLVFTVVSYRELNRRANCLARFLREQGVSADGLVGLKLNRSLAMALAILATWKAGGAYIPMDPAYPLKRVLEILADSRASLLITGGDAPEEESVPGGSTCILDLDRQEREIMAQEPVNVNPGIVIPMRSLAYVIYTSGSTGKPKGVLVEHMGMMNHMGAKINDLHLDSQSILAQNAAQTFDISVWQFFVALIPGGKTVIYPDEWVLDPERFLEQLTNHRVSILEVVPSYLAIMLETLERGDFGGLAYLVVTGEALLPELVSRWFARFPGIPLVNAYGPTEASDDITHHIMTVPPRVDRVPIGKPVQNFSIYILSPEMQLSPLRVKGEIYVSGIGVGRGYLNNLELTAQRFLGCQLQAPDDPGDDNKRNPLGENNETLLRGVQGGSFLEKRPPGRRRQKLYKTGDIGCWHADGTIEFFGREDDQVKIRGFRIELGEIENCLLKHGGIKEAVVLDRVVEGNAAICAYLVCRERLDQARLRSYLEESLPGYMVPSYFVELRQMPLTANGKIDRKVLPDPQSQVESRDFLPFLSSRMVESLPVTGAKVSAAPGPGSEPVSLQQRRPLTVEERERLLWRFNEANQDYPLEKSVQQVFREQARRVPHRVAVCEYHRWVTYEILNRRANGLARVLRNHGVGVDGIVAVLARCGIEAVLGALAALKAGGAYMPVGTQYPQERIRYMLTDSAAAILLYSSEIRRGDWSLPALGLGDERDYREGETDPVPVSGPFDLAHIFYTSGTTGNPKGSMNSHANVIHFVYGLEEKVLRPYGEGLRICQVAPFVFDAFVQQAVAALLFGHTLFITAEDLRFYGDQLLKYYQTYCIDISDGTPTHIRLLLETMKGKTFAAYIKNFVIGGEVLPRKIVEDFFACFAGDPPGITNVYGPTECCGDTTYFRVTPANLRQRERIPIGKPMPNESVYILDESLNPVPPGTAAEIYIGGDGVARGYLNRPELTQQTFLPGGPGGAVFSKSAPPGRRRPSLYKTGDLACWLPEGNIDFLGRRDHQVQIMGVRIELGEIENTLLRYEGIKAAVVVVKEGDGGGAGGDSYLYAFVVSEKPLRKTQLRDYLLAALPDYMVPSYFAQLERLPLTHNGKVNRKLLAALEIKTEAGRQYRAPGSEIEERLTAIWSEVLGLAGESLSVDANFFDLGGHSLKAIILVSRIHKELNVKVPLVDFFQAPSVQGVAAYVQKARQDSYAAIEPVEKRDYYPLSSAQQRLYVLHRMAPESIGYNTPTVVRFEGVLQREAVEGIFRRLIRRHEVLRTSFHTYRNEVIQRVHGETGFQADYGQVEEAGVKALVAAFIRPFDLEQAPLLRAGIIETGPQAYIMMVDLHHIITDGTSNGLFLRELMTLARGEALAMLRIQYKDYAGWQTGAARRRETREQEAFWLDQFSGEIPVLELPYDFPRPAVHGFEGSKKTTELDLEITAGLKRIAAREEATLFMVTLGLLTLLIAKLSGQEDVVLGTVIEGRGNADLGQVMGMFVNSLALRNRPVGDKPVRRFLQEVKSRALQAYDNQEYPFEDLVEKVGVKRDTGRNPIFDVMFSLMNIEIPEVRIPGLRLSRYGFDYNVSKFDITWLGVESGGKLSFSVGYSTGLFKEESIERFIRYFHRLAAGVAQDPDQPIAALEILSDEEKRQILSGFEELPAGSLTGQPLHRWFREQVQRTPDQVALLGKLSPGEDVEAPGVNGLRAAKRPVPTGEGPDAYGEVQLSYRQLDTLSGQLAVGLLAQGVVQDDIVGIMAGRSPELIAAMLGILKAGAGYLPVDPEYPRERIVYMLTDAKVRILVNNSNFFGDFPGAGDLRSFSLGELSMGGSRAGSSSKRPESRLPEVTAASLAYIIYTSGSTGQPRGVMVEHGNVAGLLAAAFPWFGFDSTDIWTLFHSCAFDFSVWEIYGPLLSGGRLVVVSRWVALESGRFWRLLQERGVTVLNQTPRAFYALTGVVLPGPVEATALRVVIFGGEALNPLQLREWQRRYPRVRLVNMYGITETTVHCTCKELEETDLRWHTSNIGKSLPGWKLFLADSGGSLVPLRVRGELYVGGAGVARGYLNRPEQTATKFFPGGPGGAVFSKSAPPGRRRQRLYRSGDLGRLRYNREIEYLGRIDHQVKIRGFRIELGEIESRLMAHEKIEEAVVLEKRGQDGDNLLCAYVVLGQGAVFSREGGMARELREHLARSLPDYMIPPFFTAVVEIPVTANGKVHRKALMELEGSVGDGYVPPADLLEIRLAELWQEVLERGGAGTRSSSPIGVGDNFFELGGHSLKAAILMAKIQQQWGVKVPLPEIFATPTIRGLARFIRGSRGGDYTRLEPVEKRDYYPVSSAQRRLYILHRMEPGNLSYHMLQRVVLGGAVDQRRLEETVGRLIRRHESLRTSFVMTGREPVQRVHRVVDFGLESLMAVEKAGQGTGSAGVKSMGQVIRAFHRPFDLARAPLLRVGLLKTGGGQPVYMLLVDMHHIISDGQSQEILAEEFRVLYAGKAVPALRIYYNDYCAWMGQEVQRAAIERQEAYWLKIFAGTVPVLALPTDQARPAEQSFTGEIFSFRLAPEEAQQLRRLALENGATLFMVILALFYILLARISGQEDIVIGTGVEGRKHADLRQIIGIFVNTLALRQYPQGEKTFRAFLREIKTGVLEGFENQDYPFEELVDRVVTRRDPSRNPLFDVMFQFHTAPGQQVSAQEAEAELAEGLPRKSKFDLTLWGLDTGETLYFTFEYCVHLFRADTIEKMSGYFKALAASVLADHGNQLLSLEMLTESEKAEEQRQFTDDLEVAGYH